MLLLLLFGRIPFLGFSGMALWQNCIPLSVIDLLHRIIANEWRTILNARNLIKVPCHSLWLLNPNNCLAPFSGLFVFILTAQFPRPTHMCIMLHYNQLCRVTMHTTQSVQSNAHEQANNKEINNERNASLVLITEDQFRLHMHINTIDGGDKDRALFFIVFSYRSVALPFSSLLYDKHIILLNAIKEIIQTTSRNRHRIKREIGASSWLR